MRSEDTEGGEGEEEDLEDSELEDRRLVRKCYSTDWTALRRKGSHQDFQWEWSFLSWDRGSSGESSSTSAVL